MFISLLLVVCCNALAQMHWQRPIVNFSRNDYQASGQNWMIAQHPNGWLYFANGKGLLEYDGVYWNLYPMRHNTKMTSLLIGHDNRIYAGGLREFGYFTPNRQGGLTYTSLSESITNRKVTNIWNILAIGGSFFFQGDEGLFKYKDGKITFIDCAGIAQSAIINGHLYFVNYRGLSYVKKNNKIVRLVSETLLQGYNVVALLPYGQGKMLIVKSDGKMFVYDGRNVVSHFVDVSRQMTGHKISCAAIDGNTLAIGTIDNGLYLVNIYNNNVEKINITNGLTDKSLHSVRFDLNHNLLAGLDNGISLISLDNKQFFLRGTLETIGSGYCSCIYNGSLFLGSNQGIFRTSLPVAYSKQAEITPLPGMSGQAYCLYVYDGALFCGGRDFFNIIGGGMVINNTVRRGVWNVQPIGGGSGDREVNNKEGRVKNGDAVLLGTYWGLYIARKTALGWTVGKLIDGFRMSAKTMLVEPESNNVWVANKTDGLWRVTLDMRLTKVLRKKCYNSSLLHKGDNVCVARIGNDIVVASREGLLRYDATADSLVAFTSLERKLNGHKPYTFIRQESDGGLWYASDGMLRHVNRDGRDNRTFLAGNLIEDFEDVTPMNAHSAIVGSEDGFVLVSDAKKQHSLAPFLQIRRLYVTNGKDSLAYGRSFAFDNAPVKISYRNNSIRIEYTAGYHDPSQVATFSCRLVGVDKHWSEYTTATSKEYTNLRDGSYTFEIKARIGNSIETKPVKLEFKVLPPWYRSWWAYCFYLIAAAYVAYRILWKYKKKQDALIMQKNLEISKQQEMFNKDIGEKAKQIDEKEKQIDKLEEDKLRTELQYKSDELMKSTLNVVRKNGMLQKIRKEAEALSHVAETGDKVSLRRSILRLIGQIDVNMEHDSDLKNFESSFDAVHRDFFKKLEALNPSLTHKDKILCAYIRMNLMSKEIAPLLNISVRGVEIGRYRLRKKLGLDEKDNLAEFLQKI